MGNVFCFNGFNRFLRGQNNEERSLFKSKHFRNDDKSTSLMVLLNDRSD